MIMTTLCVKSILLEFYNLQRNIQIDATYHKRFIETSYKILT